MTGIRFNLVLLVAMFVCVSTLGNRVNPACKSENDGALRCSREAYPQEECNADREYARTSHCINQDEYNTLIHYNICPICNNRNQYKGCCPPGCFVRGTQILVTDLSTRTKRWEKIENIVKTPKQFHVWAVNPNPKVTELELRDYPIRSTMYGPESEPIVTVKMSNGKVLGLTTQHAVLLDSFKMIEAKFLQIGDVLVEELGGRASVISIERQKTEDDVFNVLLDSEFPISHTVVAEGMIVGDQYWQGVLRPLLNTTLGMN